MCHYHQPRRTSSPPGPLLPETVHLLSASNLTTLTSQQKPLALLFHPRHEAFGPAGSGLARAGVDKRGLDDDSRVCALLCIAICPNERQLVTTSASPLLDYE